MNNQLHLCGTDETKEVTPIKFTMDSIDRNLKRVSQDILSALASVQDHAQRLPTDFDIDNVSGYEPHTVGYSALSSLESLNEKVRRLTLLQTQHQTLVLLKRELVQALNI